MADKEKLGQVIVNLLNNAIKYSPNNNKIDIKVASRNGRAIVSVEDKGVGIAEDEQEKIFQRFYRAHNNANNISGFGIGLYICSEIMNRHGGIVYVKSKPGQGSTFIIELPLAE